MGWSSGAAPGRGWGVGVIVERVPNHGFFLRKKVYCGSQLHSFLASISEQQIHHIFSCSRLVAAPQKMNLVTSFVKITDGFVQCALSKINKSILPAPTKYHGLHKILMLSVVLFGVLDSRMIFAGVKRVCETELTGVGDEIHC